MNASNVLQFPTQFKGFRKVRRPKCMHIGVVTPKGRIDYRFHGQARVEPTESDRRCSDIVQSVMDAMDRLYPSGDVA